MNESPRPSEPFQLVRELLSTQRYAVLSTTQQSGDPYASLVAFNVDACLRSLTFCTLRTTRKFANLTAHERVALLVDNRSNDKTDLQAAAAVTILGTCRETVDAERESLSGPFLARHPTMEGFVRSPSCAVLNVEVDAYYIVTRFQHVIELHMREGESDGAHSSPS